MDLNNKNGQPSMEEILASIRRIIAEEPTAANPVIDLHAKYRNKAEEHDDTNDFELPSIFRPAAPTPERQPLFGRLTDAIRSASGGSGDQKNVRKSETEAAEAQERYRGALRDSGTILAISNGQGGLEPSNGTHHNGEASAERYRGALRDSGGGSTLTSALSSLKLTRGTEEPLLPERREPEVAPQPVQHAPVAAVSAPVAQAASPVAPVSASGPMEDVRRVMVPFRDMRMSRMATGPSESGPILDSPALEALLSAGPMPHSEPMQAAPAPDFPAPPLQEISQSFQAAIPPIPAPPQAYDESLSLDDMHRFAAVVEQQRPPLPAAASEASGIEDTTADLLRPMLRQWLAENMPRMVEKALSIELAQSVKSTRKFNGY